MTFKPSSNCPRYHSQEHECRKRYEKCSYRKKTKKCYKKRPTRGKQPCGGLPRHDCVSNTSCSYHKGKTRQYCANRRTLRKTTRPTMVLSPRKSPAKKALQTPSPQRTTPKLRRSSRLAGMQTRSKRKTHKKPSPVKSKSIPQLTVIPETDSKSMVQVASLPRMKTPSPAQPKPVRRSTRRRTANRNFFNGMFAV